jgi:nitroimidazol reductase NimA-like FMN-containing flavoprotein (pyridoxamine 5'-phosphate oxidase superfamily)
MGREMLSNAEISAVLREAPVGRVCTNGADGYPYCVPVNFAAEGDRIYVHGAPRGTKMENLQKDAKVCFEADQMAGIIRKREMKSSCDITTGYSSVIAFGTARVLDEPADKCRALDLIMGKYAPDIKENTYPEAVLTRTALIEITVERITGKRRSPNADEYEPTT